MVTDGGYKGWWVEVFRRIITREKCGERFVRGGEKRGVGQSCRTTSLSGFRRVAGGRRKGRRRVGVADSCRKRKRKGLVGFAHLVLVVLRGLQKGL